MRTTLLAVVVAVVLLWHDDASAFLISSLTKRPLFILKNANLSDLPTGISPFEKSLGKNQNIPEQLRRAASSALQRAKQDSLSLMEIEFPPLLGEGKTQFDDFDNVQELNKNRDWCVEWLPSISSSYSDNIWFLLPDTKEVQFCKEEWTGRRYRQAARFTTIQAVTAEYSSTYAKPWGASIASALQRTMKNPMLLGDDGALDEISREVPPSLHLICQPGNGGPVEDWINCEMLHNSGNSPTLIVNGALDKVRDGYYPAFAFPKLAATVDRFYNNFEPILFLKPISDKGVYGWLYRVYPEPWQVILQTVKTDRNERQYVENSLVYTSVTRPTFALAVQKLLQGAATQAK